MKTTASAIVLLACCNINLVTMDLDLNVNDIVSFVGHNRAFNRIILPRNQLKSLSLDNRRLPFIHTGAKLLGATEDFLAGLQKESSVTFNSSSVINNIAQLDGLLYNASSPRSNKEELLSGTVLIWPYWSPVLEQIQQLLLDYGSILTMIVYRSNKIPSQTFNSFPLVIGSKLFLAERQSNGSIGFSSIYKILPDSDHVIRDNCGSWNPKTLNFTGACPFTKDLILSQRRDLKGFTVSAFYEAWEPYCILDSEDNLAGGIFPDIFDELAQALNFTPEYVRPKDRGVWGISAGNGSWTGMIGSIEKGEVMTSIAGVGVTQERSVVLQYPFLAIRSYAGVFVRRPRADDISMQAYLSEFKSDVWCMIFVYFISITLVMYVIIREDWYSPKIGFTGSLMDLYGKVINFTLSAMVGKGTPGGLKDKRLSYQISFTTVMLTGFVIFTSYRAAMNAFLSVRLPKLPVNSMKDIIKEDYGFVMWEHGMLEAYFLALPKDNTHRIAYEKSKAMGHDMYMQNSHEGVMRLADEKVVLLDYLESISNMPVFYPCAVSHVSTISLANFYVSMPFKKGNPLVDVFSRQLNNDLQQGKISKILGRYYVTSDIAQRVQCEDRKNRLGFSNTFVPFGILVTAIGLSLMLICFEAIWKQTKSAREDHKFRAEMIKQRWSEDLKIIKMITDMESVPDLDKIAKIRQILDY